VAFLESATSFLSKVPCGNSREFGRLSSFSIPLSRHPWPGNACLSFLWPLRAQTTAARLSERLFVLPCFVLLRVYLLSFPLPLLLWRRLILSALSIAFQQVGRRGIFASSEPCPLSFHSATRFFRSPLGNLVPPPFSSFFCVTQQHRAWLSFLSDRPRGFPIFSFLPQLHEVVTSL